jgi:hypothetical protein
VRFDITVEMPEVNFRVLDHLIQQWDVRTVVEIGTFLGSSAWWFAKQDQILSVICIDPFDAKFSEGFYPSWVRDLERIGIPNPYFDLFIENMVELGVREKIHVYRMLSEEAARYVGNADLIYVDGNHSREGCRRDLELYLPKANCILCGDDYTDQFPGVRQAVQELLPDYQHEDRFWWITK